MNFPNKGFFSYLPNDSRDRDWGNHATSAGYVDIAPGQTCPPAGHPDRYTFSWEKGRSLDAIF